MMQRTHHASGSPWEDAVGYSRAVRVGPFVYVAGTTATDAHGQPMAPGDAGAQAKAALRKIGEALNNVGASFADVVRTRIYVTDINDWEAVGQAHAAVFAEIRPAATLVEVSALVHPDLAVEIEVEAVIRT